MQVDERLWTEERYVEDVRAQLRHVSWASVVCTAAHKGAAMGLLLAGVGGGRGGVLGGGRGGGQRLVLDGMPFKASDAHPWHAARDPHPTPFAAVCFARHVSWHASVLLQGAPSPRWWIPSLLLASSTAGA